MSDREKTLTIVYQFGKVASTSLVNTLAKLPSLEVHQSHFLGESALQRIIPIAVDQTTNAYFHEHLRGQLLANVDLTYRMNRVLAGDGPDKLKVISLSREPLEWLRSGVLQDIAGYRSDLLAFAEDEGLAVEDELETLERALNAVLLRIAAILDAKGGIRDTVEEFHNVGGKAMLAPLGPGIPLIVRKLFFLALRPHTWFEEHFRTCFGIGLEDFECTQRIWILRRPRADFVLLRYEDLKERFADVAAALELGPVAALQRDNVSRTKPFARTVGDAFASDAAHALRDRLLLSDYAQFFGYGTRLAQPGAAAE
jgi:hypothetical protein